MPALCGHNRCAGTSHMCFQKCFQRAEEILRFACLASLWARINLVGLPAAPSRPSCSRLSGGPGLPAAFAHTPDLRRCIADPPQCWHASRRRVARGTRKVAMVAWRGIASHRMACLLLTCHGASAPPSSRGGWHVSPCSRHTATLPHFILTCMSVTCMSITCMPYSSGPRTE